MSDANRTTRRLRWTQISLKSLFVATLIVAACCGGYRIGTQHAEQMENAEREASLQAERAAAAAKQAEATAIIRAENWRIRAELEASGPPSLSDPLELDPMPFRHHGLRRGSNLESLEPATR